MASIYTLQGVPKILAHKGSKGSSHILSKGLSTSSLGNPAFFGASARICKRGKLGHKSMIYWSHFKNPQTELNIQRTKTQFRLKSSVQYLFFRSLKNHIKSVENWKTPPTERLGDQQRVSSPSFFLLFTTFNSWALHFFPSLTHWKIKIDWTGKKKMNGLLDLFSFWFSRSKLTLISSRHLSKKLRKKKRPLSVLRLSCNLVFKVT